MVILSPLKFLTSISLYPGGLYDRLEMRERSQNKLRIGAKMSRLIFKLIISSFFVSILSKTYSFRWIHVIAHPIVLSIV